MQAEGVPEILRENLERRIERDGRLIAVALERVDYAAGPEVRLENARLINAELRRGRVREPWRPRDHVADLDRHRRDLEGRKRLVDLWPSRILLARPADGERRRSCLLYTSDAADERSSVD